MPEYSIKIAFSDITQLTVAIVQAGADNTASHRNRSIIYSLKWNFITWDSSQGLGAKSFKFFVSRNSLFQPLL